MKTTHREYFRIIPPGSFSYINTIGKGADRKMIETMEEAEQVLEEFGSAKKGSEYYEYWQGIKKECKIVRVTEIIEEDTNSTIHYDTAPEMLKELQKAREKLYNKNVEDGIHALQGDEEQAKKNAEVFVSSIDALIRKATK